LSIGVTENVLVVGFGGADLRDVMGPMYEESIDRCVVDKAWFVDDIRLQESPGADRIEAYNS
jgi:hypothetical protein